MLLYNRMWTITIFNSEIKKVVAYCYRKQFGILGKSWVPSPPITVPTATYAHIHFCSRVLVWIQDKSRTLTLIATATVVRTQTSNVLNLKSGPWSNGGYGLRDAPSHWKWKLFWKLILSLAMAQKWLIWFTGILGQFSW